MIIKLFFFLYNKNWHTTYHENYINTTIYTSYIWINIDFNSENDFMGLFYKQKEVLRQKYRR